MVVAEIDLTDPKVRVLVSPGGPDPDGDGPWQTTLMPPTRIAARDSMELVVNGDFFRARGSKVVAGSNSPYQAALWSAVTGPAVTDGKVWSINRDPRPCLVVSKHNTLTIEMRQHPKPDDAQVVAGNTLLVDHGVALPHKNKARHPRTAVGLAVNARRLVILVVDGRVPGMAIGMNYDELAAEMIRLGCVQALNLDGGGSSIMALRNPESGKYQILNHPSDGRERPVANVLGVTILGQQPPALLNEK